MFRSFLLKILGGSLSDLEHDRLLCHISTEILKYPVVAGEIRRFLDEQVESISDASFGVLRAVTYQWWLDRAK
jgi:hypothetical protein